MSSKNCFLDVWAFPRGVSLFCSCLCHSAGVKIDAGHFDVNQISLDFVIMEISVFFVNRGVWSRGRGEEAEGGEGAVQETLTDSTGKEKPGEHR